MNNKTDSKKIAKKPTRRRDLRMIPKAGYSVERRRLSAGGKYA